MPRCLITVHFHHSPATDHEHRTLSAAWNAYRAATTEAGALRVALQLPGQTFDWHAGQVTPPARRPAATKPSPATLPREVRARVVRQQGVTVTVLLAPDRTRLLIGTRLVRTFATGSAEPRQEARKLTDLACALSGLDPLLIWRDASKLTSDQALTDLLARPDLLEQHCPEVTAPAAL